MKRILKALFAFAITASCLGAAAEYPDRSLKIVVPYAPGGAPDTLARLFAEELSKLLGQPVVVDNKPGAGSVIGTQFVASAPADGYTLLMVDSPFTTAPALYGDRVKYNISQDFAPLVFVGTTPLYLYASGESSIQNVADLARTAQASGHGISYGSGGTGSLTHLLGEMLQLETGTPMTHVPYRSVTLAMGDLVAGQLQMQFSSYASARSYVDTGRIRPIAVTGSVRTKEAPDVPTFEELGVKGFDVTLWWGVVAPSGVSPAVRSRLADALARIMTMPQTTERLLALNIDIAANVGPEALRQTMEVDQTRFQDIVTRAQLKVE